MGRFLAIVIALVAIALLINSFQSKEKPLAKQEPALIEPEKSDAPEEIPSEVAAAGEKAIEMEVAAVDPAVVESAAFHRRSGPIPGCEGRRARHDGSE